MALQAGLAGSALRSSPGSQRACCGSQASSSPSSCMCRLLSHRLCPGLEAPHRPPSSGCVCFLTSSSISEDHLILRMSLCQECVSISSISGTKKQHSREKRCQGHVVTARGTWSAVSLPDSESHAADLSSCGLPPFSVCVLPDAATQPSGSRRKVLEHDQGPFTILRLIGTL